jgi:hypothetical protein
MCFRPDCKKLRPLEIFGRILNLPIVAFQTGMIKFLSKARLAKVEAGSFLFVGCRRYLSSLVDDSTSELRCFGTRRCADWIFKSEIIETFSKAEFPFHKLMASFLHIRVLPSEGYVFRR